MSKHGRFSAGGSILGCEGRSCPLSLMGSSSAQLSLFDNFIINLFINSSTAVRKRKQEPILMPDFWKSHSTRNYSVKVCEEGVVPRDTVATSTKPGHLPHNTKIHRSAYLCLKLETNPKYPHHVWR